MERARLFNCSFFHIVRDLFFNYFLRHNLFFAAFHAGVLAGSPWAHDVSRSTSNAIYYTVIFSFFHQNATLAYSESFSTPTARIVPLAVRFPKTTTASPTLKTAPNASFVSGPIKTSDPSPDVS
jgi:hypothetical protein